MKIHFFSKLAAITPNTLIIGVDIAKNTHWARFTDYRGIPPWVKPSKSQTTRKALRIF